MNRTIAIVILVAWTVVVACSAMAAPWVLSDKNRFLQGFVNHEFLGFMGVLVTITLASAANLFIELNKMEKEVGRAAFPKTKQSVKDSAYGLIAFLTVSVALVILKPVLALTPVAETIANGIAIGLIIGAIMALIDLTQTAFKLSAATGFGTSQPDHDKPDLEAPKTPTAIWVNITVGIIGLVASVAAVLAWKQRPPV